MITLLEAYKISFETWRFQVESYWTRTSYFAVFEAAAAAGAWKLTEGHGVTAALFSLLSLALTMVWMSNNRRSHEYVRFWWEQIIEIEKLVSKHTANIAAPPLASDFERWRTKYRREGRSREFGYAKMIRLVPYIFAAGWLYVLGFNLRNVGIFVSRTGHW